MDCEYPPGCRWQAASLIRTRCKSTNKKEGYVEGYYFICVSVGVLCLYFAFLLYEWFLNKNENAG